MVTENITESKLKKIFIGDSGATYHMVISGEIMTDLRDIEYGVKIGNGTENLAIKIGIKYLKTENENGSYIDVFSKNANVVPQLE